jgi:hypothetical protein
MTLKQQEQEKRAKVYAEAVRFMKDNPQVGFAEVGAKFGISHMQASRVWKLAGYGARASGRIAGVSPLKKGTS